MKKIIAMFLVTAIIGLSVNAQEIPQRKQGGFKPQGHQGLMKHHRGGIDKKKLNLTDAQKEQFKAQHESFRKQLEELKKNENITVKEWKIRMENLRKENKTKMDGILTSEQKAQIEKMKTEQKAMHEIDAKAQAEKMKLRLGLSDEQSAKLQKNRTEMAEKIKAIHENKSLSDEKKKEEMKELMKKQKETMKSILTEEQMKKLQEGRKQKPGGMHGQKNEKKEVI